MEHRWKKRRQLSLDVVVRTRNALILHGKSRDISHDGMSIQLAVQAVPINAMVEIEFPGCGCLHAWVMHVGDDGIGVMFRLMGNAERELLSQLLVEKSPA